jgi:xylulose-5-phosphate/fructose-6-phosphate phosphoketolase
MAIHVEAPRGLQREKTELDADESFSAYGKTRSTLQGSPLCADELRRIDAYWRASLYLCMGMLYLTENPLLKEPLSLKHTKKRLLGHWGSDAGQCFTYVHFNRLINKYDLDAMYISGPGHGAPAVLSQAYLEGTYSEIYPDKSEDEAGLQRFFKQFSFPGGIGSHATPETPGSIHEGGELGYSLSHAFGAAFDHPELIALCVVGDGECETGPLATSWHSNKFLNPITDGAVLPVLHLNGYKIDSPTLVARIDHDELAKLFEGYGWTPYFVEGCERVSMHQAMAVTLEHCVLQIRQLQQQARSSGVARRARWPMVILRSPKGWTAPRKVDGHYLEGYWRSHQIPLPDIAVRPDHLALVEEWMRGYGPEELFDDTGRLIPELKELAPKQQRRMSANPVANGGLLRKPLDMPEFRAHAIAVDRPGVTTGNSMETLGLLVRDVMRMNMDRFRVFGPDETTSNKLTALYEVTKKSWLAGHLEEDSDGGNLAADGRIMEMLSEHTLEGWLEGYLLTGRHGLFASYESFIHIVDSMVNQHAKWLEKSRELSWRASVSSLNLLLTSTVWRQDHNGFTHQDPGFLDVLGNKSPEVIRIYLPPDANCMLSVADHCLRSRDYINVIVADKNVERQYLSMNAAVEHCTKGIGVWDWASNDQGVEPDVVMAAGGDLSTLEALAATALLRQLLPNVKIRFVNVVDLFKLTPHTEHPHGMTDIEYESIFTTDKPVVFNFHSYPWLIHKLTYRRPNQHRLHVRGYKEKGSIDTPLELMIRNETDRFSLAIDAIDRMPRFRTTAAHARDALVNQRIASESYAYEFGIDRPEITRWAWPF